jgi:very-short-patch-repair endonuclease
MKRRYTEIARKLRRNQTDAERRLWSRLRDRRLAGAKFRQQVPVAGYIADFLCEDAKLIVEVDGGQHTDEKDSARTVMMEAGGYRLVRFWNNDILTNLDGVLQQIVEMLQISGQQVAAPSPHPVPLPMGEGTGGD